MKIKEMVEYAKQHKKEILIVVGTGAVVAIAGVVGYKYLKPSFDIPEIPKKFEPKMFEPKKFQLGVGIVEDIWSDHDHTMLTVGSIPIGDVGKFGEALREKLGATEDETLDVIMALSKNYNVNE